MKLAENDDGVSLHLVDDDDGTNLEMREDGFLGEVLSMRLTPELQKKIAARLSPHAPKPAPEPEPTE